MSFEGIGITFKSIFKTTLLCCRNKEGDAAEFGVVHFIYDLMEIDVV